MVWQHTGDFCPDCGEPGYEVRLRSGEWVAGSCLTCHKRESRATWLRYRAEQAAQFAPLNPDATLEEFRTDLPHREQGMAAARNFLKNVRRGDRVALVLWSAPDPGESWSGYGTGKTHIASALAREYRKRGWDVVSWVAPDLMSEIRSTYSDYYEGDEGTEWGIIRKATQCDLLIIDDLGEESFKDWSWYKEKAFRIINARYCRGPMIITTTLRPVDLPGHVGPPAYSRLWEMTHQGDAMYLVNMSGPDIRFEKGE